MEKDSGVPAGVLRTDGGMVENELLMQFQADLIQKPVIKTKIEDSTSLGAAFAAGLSVGVWKSLDDIKNHIELDKTFAPGNDTLQTSYSQWKKAVQLSIGWQK